LASVADVPPRDPVVVEERRSRELSRNEREALLDNAQFWQLVDRGYFGVTQTGHDRYVLQGKKYVGRALLETVELRCAEKIPGTVAALIRAATGSEVRLPSGESPGDDELGLTLRHLARSFVEAAASYIATRRKPRFRYRPASGPVLAGSMNLAATMRLHALGRRGSFAFDRCEVVRDEPLDRLVLAALDELSRSARALRLPPKVLYDARWLAGALAAVRDQDFLRISRSRFIEIATALEVDPGMPDDDVDLARLAAVVLLQRGFDLESDGPNTPRAWFIDLETLFELAVRRTLSEKLAPIDVDKGESLDRRLFHPGSDKGLANPDLVVHQGHLVKAVGDVKYKALVDVAGNGSKKQSRADLYQLLVHTASLGGDKAFLVYPAEDRYVVRHHGKAATGPRTWTFAVRPQCLAADLKAAVDELALAGGPQATAGRRSLRRRCTRLPNSAL
jgi:hypothetical protein